MSTITDIVEAAERLRPEDFLKLRTALDQVEEKLWKHELNQATARHRKARLTDSRIDELVMKRRYKGRTS